MSPSIKSLGQRLNDDSNFDGVIGVVLHDKNCNELLLVLWHSGRRAAGEVLAWKGLVQHEGSSRQEYSAVGRILYIENNGLAVNGRNVLQQLLLRNGREGSPSLRHDVKCAGGLEAGNVSTKSSVKYILPGTGSRGRVRQGFVGGDGPRVD